MYYSAPTEYESIGSGAFSRAYVENSKEYEKHSRIMDEIWDTGNFPTSETPKRVIIVADDSQFKYDYLKRLGLIVEPIEGYDNKYTITVPYLLRYSALSDNDSVKEQAENLRDEFSRMTNYYRQMYRHFFNTIIKQMRQNDADRAATIYALRKLKANAWMFPHMNEIIETLYDYRLLMHKGFNFDLHDGNLAVCPITGKVILYDPIAIWGYLQ